MKVIEVAKKIYQHQDYFEVSTYLFLGWRILLRGCEGEMWGWMEFYYYSLSETFVVLTADQFVGRDDGPFEQQKRSHISSDFKKKQESSLQRRRSLRNWEQGMEFLTCDGCEDEYNK